MDQCLNLHLHNIHYHLHRYFSSVTCVAINTTFPSHRIGRDLRRDKGSYSNDALQRDQEREAHKVMKILTVVVIVFALLMLPNHIVFLWFDFGNGSK